MKETSKKLKTITFFTLKITEQGLIFEKKEEVFEVAKLQFVKTVNDKTIRLNPSTLNKIHINFDIVVLDVHIWYKTANKLTIEEENIIRQKMINELNKRVNSIERNINLLKSFQK